MLLMFRQKVRLIVAVMLSALAVGLFVPVVALASTYGSGAYNTCTYSDGCPASSSSGSSGSTTKPKSSSSVILLNDFPAYLDGSGKQLDLVQGQIICFEVTTNGETTKYCLTVNKIGSDFVDITVGTIKLHMLVGETQLVDVNGDGINDISITLDGIMDGKASFTFKALGAPTQTPSTNSTTPTTKQKSSINWLLILSIAAIIIGGLIFIILLIRRRKRHDQQNMWPPSQ